MWELAWLKISTEPASKPALKIKRVKIRGKHNQTNRKSAVRTFQRTITNPQPLILRAIKKVKDIFSYKWKPIKTTLSSKSATLLKRDSGTDAFLWFLGNF